MSSSRLALFAGVLLVPAFGAGCSSIADAVGPPTPPTPMVHIADAREPAELWAWCVQDDQGGSCGTGAPPADLPVLGTGLVLPVSLPDGWAVQASSRPVGCAWGASSLPTEVTEDQGVFQIDLAKATGVVDVDINASGPAGSTLSATARWDTGLTANTGC